MTFPDLSESEQRLWQAAGTGQWADFRAPGDDGASAGADWGPDRAIRAEVMRALLAGAAGREPQHPGGAGPAGLAVARSGGVPAPPV